MEHAVAESASGAKENPALAPDVSLNGRDDSPNCVIALAATSSHSSSASGSMDRRVHENSSTSEAAWSDCAQNAILEVFQRGNATRQEVQSPETGLREYANVLKYANGDKDSKDLPESWSSLNGNPFTGSCTSAAANSTSIQPPANCVSHEDQEIDPSNYSFSSALRECQHKKSQGMRFHASKGSDSSPEYGLVKTAAVMSTSNRFTDRERRTACMDVIGDHQFNSREQVRYCYSPRLGLKESQRHRKMHGSTRYPDQLTSPDRVGKEDLHRKHCNELYQDSARVLRTFPSPGMSSGGGSDKGSTSANACYNNSGHLAAENHIRTQTNMKQLLVTGKSKWDDADKWLVGRSSGEIPPQEFFRNAPYCTRDFNPRSSFKSKHGPAGFACPSSPSATVFNGRKSESCVNQGSDIILMNESNYNIKVAPVLLHDRDSKVFSNSRINPAAQMDRMILPRQDAVRENSKLSVSSEKEFAGEDPKQCVGYSIRDAATHTTPAVLKTKDTGTQMSPPGSSCASPCKTPLKSSSSPTRDNTPSGRSASGNNSALGTSELQSCHLAKLELQRAESSKAKNINIISNRISTTDPTDAGDDHIFGADSKCTGLYLDIGNCKKTLAESRSVRWEEAERVKCQASFRYKREAAKITAWENHQKAKAEAKLKKLEVRLEKLRSYETEKIMRKLTAAEKKAEDMRIAAAAAAAAHQADHMARTPDNAAALIRRTGHSNGTLTACFTCRV